jgi:membrane protein YqaA with SNARE-associated domain
MLRRTYDSIMSFASHRHAIWWLNLIAFVESSFFPFPPDPLFMAMILKQRDKAWFIAFQCTVSSVLGGVLGYYIGYGLYETVGLWIIDTYGLEQSFINFQRQFDDWGFLIIALKGLIPIPYKIVTISSGLAGFDFKTFIIASIIARGSRFGMLAGLLTRYGSEIKDFIDDNLYLATTAGLLALAGGFILFKYVF